MTAENKDTSRDPRSDCPDSPEGKGRKIFLEHLRGKRQKGGRGNQYYFTALKHSVPMVFCRYDGHSIAGTIAKDGGYTFTLKTKEGHRLVVDKTDLQFSYRARSHGAVTQAIRIDEQIRSMKNPPVEEISQRYHIPDETLQRCQEEGNRLRLTMRGGEVLEGRIEWFGAYDIKLELATGKSVVVFRHAVYSHEVVGKEKG
jgi:sRNA-binding regulator protein Hfq